MDGQWFPKQAVQFEAPPRALDPWANRDFFEIITGLNLTSGLKLVLDAGDASSYTSGQSWLDLAGSGYDFFRGDDGSATSTDPTFNGSAGGLSSSEYFSFDGGDYFTYDSSNETWMEDMHKAGAAFSIMQWVYLTSNNTAGFWGTAEANTTQVGVVFRTGSGGTTVLQIPKGTGGLAFSHGSSLTVPTSQWALVGLSLDSSDGSTGVRHFVNGSSEAASGTLSSPSSSSATYTARVAALGGGGGRFQSGSRLAAAIVWEGVALTTAQMENVFDGTRDRFGV